MIDDKLRLLNKAAREALTSNDDMSWRILWRILDDVELYFEPSWQISPDLNRELAAVLLIIRDHLEVDAQVEVVLYFELVKVLLKQTEANVKVWLH